MLKRFLVRLRAARQARADRELAEIIQKLEYPNEDAKYVLLTLKDKSNIKNFYI